MDLFNNQPGYSIVWLNTPQPAAQAVSIQPERYNAVL
jgi:hypothetical protein